MIHQWLLLAAGLCACSAASAQALGKKLAPGLRIYPEIAVSSLYDDNFFYTSRGKTVDAYGILVRPGLSLIKEGGRYQLQAGARAEIGRFDTGGKDDYEDTDIFAEARYILTHRNRIRLRYERNGSHDPFGRVRTEGSVILGRKLDRFHDKKGTLRYKFGTPGALFNLEYGLIARTRDYETNRFFTRFLDYTRITHQGTLSVGYSPRTTGLLRLIYTDLSYQNNIAGFPTRDSKVERALVGASYSGTAKISGQFLVGVRRRDPDASRRDSDTRLDWDIRLNWSPRRTTTFTFTTGRREYASFVRGSDTIDTRKYQLDWLQQYTHRFSTSLDVSYYNQDFSDVSREDDFYRVDLTANYKLTRKLSLVGLLSYIDRESNARFRDFSKNIISIGFKYAP